MTYEQWPNMQNNRDRRSVWQLSIAKTNEASRAYNIRRTAIMAANKEFGMVAAAGRDGKENWRRRKNIDVYFRLHASTPRRASPLSSPAPQANVRARLSAS